MFCVSAELTYDIYYLYVQNDVLFEHAFIPNLKTSIMMNKIFRRIVENDCLDKVEESEDEEDFENIRYDKYVDLNKRVLMECVFHHKFKKWVPVREGEENGRSVPRIDDFLHNNIKYKDNSIHHGHKQQYHKFTKHVRVQGRGGQEKKASFAR